jgi:hypothetical protein
MSLSTLTRLVDFVESATFASSCFAGGCPLGYLRCLLGREMIRTLVMSDYVVSQVHVRSARLFLIITLVAMADLILTVSNVEGVLFEREGSGVRRDHIDPQYRISAESLIYGPTWSNR